MRAKDGFHLNTEGAEILALKIADAITADLKARGAAVQDDAAASLSQPGGGV